MSDIKKFLDYEGVQYLWSKVNMNDYPNNAILMEVINAIDETKADVEHNHAVDDITGLQELGDLINENHNAIHILVGDTSVQSQRIDAIEAEMIEGLEAVTSEEISALFL